MLSVSVMFALPAYPIACQQQTKDKQRVILEEPKTAKEFNLS